METLFNCSKTLDCNLVKCIGLIGLSVKTLRGNSYLDILIQEKNHAQPEIIFQLPPGSQVIKQNYAEVIGK